MLLIIVDSFSKWIEVIPVNYTTLSLRLKHYDTVLQPTGIRKLLFQIMGPYLLVRILHFFLKTNDMKHIKSAPYHSTTNGCAGRVVRTFKTMVKKLK